MAMEFGVLASGSSGNASVVLWAGRGVLIDLGIGSRLLSQRLGRLGLGWNHLGAAVLTHVHGDHWTESGFRQIHKLGIPLYCHPEQAAWLMSVCPAFADLAAAGLIHHYHIGQTWMPVDGLGCRPLQLNHDGGVTCGFRFAGQNQDQHHSLAYLADLGGWGEGLINDLVDVDVLALEFNHDVMLERTSGREPTLIARVLGDQGHLSNEQAASLAEMVARRSAPGQLKDVVQLHLSRQCNTPELAQAAARRVLHAGIAVHTAQQSAPGPMLRVGARRRPVPKPEALVQGNLPGW